VEAPAQGDEGGNPGEVENPGEHRASDGLNTRLDATNSRGEKGPEDEPFSQRTACLHRARPTASAARRTDGEYPVCKRGSSFGWWQREGRAMDVEQVSTTSMTERKPGSTSILRPSRVPPAEAGDALSDRVLSVRSVRRTEVRSTYRTKTCGTLRDRLIFRAFLSSKVRCTQTGV
jgi:hypothetical protein